MTTSRINGLDLLRGFAVLGIVLINMPGFAGPSNATLSPHQPIAGSIEDAWTFAVLLLLAEGKMRTLFTMLFGASMLLFIHRADARGANGTALQFRRLGWLALIGYLHFILLWWGDILFLYAVTGCIALAFRHAPPRLLASAGLALFLFWQLFFGAATMRDVAAEEMVWQGSASPAQILRTAEERVKLAKANARELREMRSGFVQHAQTKLQDQAFKPLNTALFVMGETLPLMLIGMALFKTGFFSGGWPKRRLRQLAIGGVIAGALPTLALIGWAMPRDFPPIAIRIAIIIWTGLPHLAMALGYAALIMLYAPRMLESALGQRIAAAGRMAFSNYLGTTLAMTAIFYGWGLGLAGSFGHAQQLWFVAAVWAVMLGWSTLWLVHFRQGPMEWLWRSLTECRLLPMRVQHPQLT